MLVHFAAFFSTEKTVVAQIVTIMMALWYVSLCVHVTNRLPTTLQESGGERTSIWRIQSTTPDGSLNTSWEKVSASQLYSIEKTYTYTQR